VKNNGVTLYAKDALLAFFSQTFLMFAQVVNIHHHEV